MNARARNSQVEATLNHPFPAQVCAAHSAITLAPVLGALAAAELADGVDVDLLSAAWRPDRFDAG